MLSLLKMSYLNGFAKLINECKKILYVQKIGRPPSHGLPVFHNPIQYSTHAVSASAENSCNARLYR